MIDPDELVAGTSLTNASSVLAVECVLKSDGDRLVSWFGVAGRSYIFEYVDSLSVSSWETYPFEISGSDSVISFLDSAINPTRFYRVKVRQSERY